MYASLSLCVCMCSFQSEVNLATQPERITAEIKANRIKWMWKHIIMIYSKWKKGSYGIYAFEASACTNLRIICRFAILPRFLFSQRKEKESDFSITSRVRNCISLVNRRHSKRQPFAHEFSRWMWCVTSTRFSPSFSHVLQMDTISLQLPSI